MPNLLPAFIAYIQEHQLFRPQDRLLLAVSGGVDSVVLCDLCAKAGYSFTIAHCNFGLRGAESERDEQFVRSLGNVYGVPVLVKNFDTKQVAEAQKISIQEAARNLRYAWFEEIVNDEQTIINDDSKNIHHYILTAHHMDDNVETVLMNFFKGTGISGLRGILPKQGRLVRPLLFVSKKQVEAYAQEHRLAWVQDSSNLETKYTRNYFRHTIIPLVEKVYPQAVQNINDNIQRFGEVELLYQQAVQQHIKRLVEVKGTERHIPVLKLLQTQPLHTVIYEIIKPYGFTHRQVPEVIKLLSSETGRYMASATHRIIRNRKWLVITPLQPAGSQTIVIEKETDELVFDACRLRIKRWEAHMPSLTADPHMALVDAKELQYPLLLRKWRPGDYFYPLGMKKKKKLSRFFIDQKLSKPDKEHIWVLESHKKVVWVVGHRIDDRFKITPATKKAVQFSIASL